MIKEGVNQPTFNCLECGREPGRCHNNCELEKAAWIQRRGRPPTLSVVEHHIPREVSESQ